MELLEHAEHEPGKGLQASFITNGKEESLTVVGKQQYLKMDHQTQHAYTGFKNKDGAELYYKYEFKKPMPTQTPKKDSSGSPDPNNPKPPKNKGKAKNSPNKWVYETENLPENPGDSL